jgi:hypothetical protein
VVLPQNFFKLPYHLFPKDFFYEELVGTTGICDFVCVAAYFVLVDSD